MMTLTGFVWLFTSSWNDPGLMTLSLTPTGLCSWKRVARLDQKSVWRYYFYWIRSDPGIPTKWKHWADLIVAGKATGRTARQVRESIGNLFPCWNSFAFHAEPQCWAAGTGTVENRTNCCIRWPVGSDWDEFGFFVRAQEFRYSYSRVAGRRQLSTGGPSGGRRRAATDWS